jgi:hypothetical protein
MSINNGSIYLIYFIAVFFAWCIYCFKIVSKSNQYKINKNIFLEFDGEFFMAGGFLVLLISIIPITLIIRYFL